MLSTIQKGVFTAVTQAEIKIFVEFAAILGDETSASFFPVDALKKAIGKNVQKCNIKACLLTATIKSACVTHHVKVAFEKAH